MSESAQKDLAEYFGKRLIWRLMDIRYLMLSLFSCLPSVQRRNLCDLLGVERFPTTYVIAPVSCSQARMRAERRWSGPISRSPRSTGRWKTARGSLSTGAGPSRVHQVATAHQVFRAAAGPTMPPGQACFRQATYP